MHSSSKPLIVIIGQLGFLLLDNTLYVRLLAPGKQNNK